MFVAFEEFSLMRSLFSLIIKKDIKEVLLLKKC